MLNLLSSLNKFCVWSVMCSGNVFLLCQRTIVVPYLVRINIDSFGVIILLQANATKSLFLLFSQKENWAKLSIHFKLHVQVSTP